MSTTRTSGINTSDFDAVYPFHQSLAIAGTQHRDGLCGAFSTIFLQSMLSAQPLQEFKNPNYKALYSQAVKTQTRICALERDGEDGDALAFHEMNLETQLHVIQANKVKETLQRSKVALLKYKTRTGEFHQIGFGRLFEKCVIHDSNRFTGVAKCDLAYASLREIILENGGTQITINSLPR